MLTLTVCLLYLLIMDSERFPPLCGFSMTVVTQDENSVVLSLGADEQHLIVSAQPFRLDIVEGPQVLLSLNSRGLLAFEHLRLRKDT